MGSKNAVTVRLDKITQPAAGRRANFVRHLISDGYLTAKAARIRFLLIEGQPGQGKTTFASQFMEEIGALCAWYGLGHEDRDPLSFVFNFAHSLKQNLKLDVAALMGYQFWSAPFTWSDGSVDIPHGYAEINITRAGVPQSGARVYLFTAAGSYLGSYLTTNDTGKVHFYLPNVSFKFRADYAGRRVWSDVLNIVQDVVNQAQLELGP